MFKPSLVLSFVVVIATGCGASALPDRASMPQSRWTDGDWYAQAVENAMEAYEADVQRASSISYSSHAEADAVAVTHGPARFDAHLEGALHAYGLSRRGMALYGERHPEFVEQQARLNTTRMQSIRSAALGLRERVRPSVEFVAFAEPTDSPAQETLAAR